MNTKVITNTIIKSLPNFPTLEVNKRNRIVTKHFTNLYMYLPQHKLALLSWLIYQTKTDNSFIYSTNFLRLYRNTVLAVKEEYGILKINVSLTFLRQILKNLVEEGYILPMQNKKFVINYMLTFHPKFITNKEWDKVCKSYLKMSKEISSYQLIEFTRKVMTKFADESLI